MFPGLEVHVVKRSHTDHVKKMHFGVNCIHRRNNFNMVLRKEE